MPDKPIKVSRARFARMAGVTPQSVSQWIADGLPADNAGKRGQRIEIDLDAALPAFFFVVFFLAAMIHSGDNYTTTGIVKTYRK